MTEAKWYFDFLSPFAYLQFNRFKELPSDLRLTIKPVLLSVLLSRWEHKGPAEIPSKRRFVYRFLKWQASRRGIPFTLPPIHPFNPLPPLRLALLGGSSTKAVGRIFHFIYQEGRNVEGREAISELGSEMGIPDAFQRISDPDIKEALRANNEEAVAAEIFGVPSLVANGELFWGDDATDMFLEYLKDPTLFDSDDMRYVSDLPMGLQRRNP